MKGPLWLCHQSEPQERAMAKNERAVRENPVSQRNGGQFLTIQEFSETLRQNVRWVSWGPH